MSLKRRLPILIIGFILGLFIYLGPSIILSFLALCGIYYFIISRPEEEKNALIKVVTVGFILRLAVFAVVIFIVYSSGDTRLSESFVISKVVGHNIQLFRDFGREILNGIQMRRYLSGEFGNVALKDVSYQGYGFIHTGAWTQGILNLLFGESIFNLLLFPILDLLSIIIIYYLTKIIFDKQAAILSSCIYTITPSIIVISCSNIRFSISIFSLLLIGLSLVRFSRTNKLKHLFILALGIVLFCIFKEKFRLPILMVTPLLLLMALNIRFRIKFTLLIMAIFFLVILASKSEFIQWKLLEELQNLIGQQVGFVTTAQGNIYKIYDDVIYVRDIKELPIFTLIKTLPRGLLKGIFYFMLVPFPWQIDNTARLYAYPQIIWWYFVIPFALLGMLKGMLYKPKETLPIIILCLYFTVLLSLVIGNEGIAVRFRDLVSPFFYIFASCIFSKFIVPKTAIKDTL